jgi:SUMO ligase MMS21 Smc5/6 complex component
LVQTELISVQSSESLIDNLLGKTGNDEDDEISIVQQSVKVSLKCPITMKRMKLPVRGKRCKHVDVCLLYFI